MNLKYETIKAAVSGDKKAMDEVLNEYEPYMDGYYLGHTCLTLEMAYLNARLIGRPVAPWLLELVN